MVDISNNQSNILKIDVFSANSVNPCNISNDSSGFNADIAKNWAIKMDDTVDGTEFSSKYYALQSKIDANESKNAKEQLLNNSDFLIVANDLNNDNTIGICAENILDIQNVNNNVQTVIQQAQIATEQAQIATNKAAEASITVDDSITEITNIANERIELIQSEAETQISNIQQTGFYMSEGKLFYIDENGEEHEFEAGGGDSIPLFTGMYFDFKPKNVSWLKSGKQANSGGIYTSAYNTLVNCLTEADNIYDLKVIATEDMEEGTDYSEYWKVNQDEMYFITPTKLSYGMLNSQMSTAQLYFKVANAVQNLELLNAGEILESLSDISASLSDISSSLSGVSTSLSEKIGRQECKAYITETYNNGTSGYNIYSNKYCEQWGYTTTSNAGETIVNLLKPYRDTNYNVVLSTLSTVSNTSSYRGTGVYSIHGVNSFSIYAAYNKYWCTKGYLA